MGSRKYRQNVEKELTCIHCEEKFIGHYNRKRCDPCKEIFTVSVRASKHEKEYYADLEKSRKRARDSYHRNKHRHDTPEKKAHKKNYIKNWRKQNYQHELETTRAYWRKNTDKRAAITNRYRSHKKNARIPSTDDRKISLIFKSCREKTDATGIPHEVDHIIPLSIGGADHQDNLRIITKQENGLKSAAYVPNLGGVWANNKLARATKKKLGIKE